MIVASISHDNSIKFYEIVDYFNKRKGVPLQDAPDVFPERIKQKEMDEDEAEEDDEFEDDSSEDMDDEDKPK